MKQLYKVIGIAAVSTTVAIGTILHHAPQKDKGFDIKSYDSNSITVAEHTPAPDNNQPANPTGTTAGESASPNTFFAYNLEQGDIGIINDKSIDNPIDNVFHIQLHTKPTATHTVWLEYELNGVADFTSVSRSVNDELATGGHFVQKREGWTLQRERINPASLKTGENIVRFSVPQDAEYGYQVRNVRFRTENTTNQAARQLVMNQPAAATYFGTEGYAQGFLTGKDADKATVRINGTEITAFKGAFEEVIARASIDKPEWTATVEATYPDGETLSTEIRFTHSSTFDLKNEWKKETLYAETQVKKAAPFTLNIDETKLTAGAGAVAKATPISMTGLRDVDYAALDAGMINVSGGANGFRFLPHGTTFDKEVRLEMAYDSTLIPEGYTAEDIRTYYFDENTHHWVALPRDTVLLLAQTVVSKTTHFTDMINAIITVPESPETQSYTPTSMKDIKVANPAANINQIEAPSANSMGSAGLSYPINIPAGRQGMQPGLGLQYNSGGGNGWLGLGWDVAIPSIEVETRWGVPRYDPDKESETYTFAGEQLTPLAHRSEWVARATGDKQFYPRIEGAYSKIIRHGDKPAEYWWEVTDKDGTRHFYGGSPDGNSVIPTAILSDAKGNIGHWALVETRDVNGNFVRYHYDLKPDPGVAGGTPGKQLYIQKITYTGHNGTEGAYSVEFFRDRTADGSELFKRKDVIINARLGFKQVTADVLQAIVVKFGSETVRSYGLKYTEGAFVKTLLQSVSEYDAEGALFHTHTFDYYDDVRRDGQYYPFNERQEWNAGTDDVHGDFITGNIPEFNDRASAISGTKSWNAGGGISIGVGLATSSSTSKNMTGGANLSFTHGESHGMLALVDINGDGLADKVMKINGKLCYRPQLRATEPDGTPSFGDIRPIYGANDFLHEVSNNFDGGLEVQFKPASASAGVTVINSKTKTYFSDVNGDGLIDLVSSGRTYFNRLDDNGNPHFEGTSAGTPSPVLSGAALSADLFPFAQEELNEAIERSPLHDVVRMWQAPYDGAIRIEAPIALIENTSEERPGYSTADGVRAAIQLKGSEKWSAFIAADNYSEIIPDNVDSLTVTRGDRVYFRLQSVQDGMYDQVLWNPVITYLKASPPSLSTGEGAGSDSLNLAELDANGQARYVFTADKDFVVSADYEVGMPIAGKIHLTAGFRKPATSDDVRIVALLNNSTLLERDYGADSVVNEPITIDFTVNEDDVLTFNIITSSNVDWPALQWKPYGYYSESYNPDVKILFKNDTIPVIDFYATPKMSIYAREWVLQQPLDTARTDSLGVIPELKFATPPFVNMTGQQVTMVVKHQNQLLGKRTYPVIRDVNDRDNDPASNYLLPVDTLFVAATSGKDIYVEYYTTNPTLGMFIYKPNARLVHLDSTGTQTATDTLYAGFYSPVTDDETIFGHLYRGWGQFAYNGNKEWANQPIDQSVLNADEMKNAAKEENTLDTRDGQTTDEINDGINSDGNFEASKARFILMTPNAEQGRWQGFDEMTYLAKDTVSSSRMGEKDVTPMDPTANGAGATAVDKHTRTWTLSAGAGTSVGSKSGSASGSYGWSFVKSDFMDMNGDRYPDILSDDKVQYSAPTGGLSEFKAAHPGDHNHYTNTVSAGVSFGLSKSKTTRDPATNPKRSYFSSITGTVGGSAGVSMDNATHTWMDINGDGLPDRVYDDGTVQLNLGYSFTPRERWSDDIPVRNGAGVSLSASTGVGESFTNVDKDQTSWSIGVGLSRSDNYTLSSIQDVNGDGLPDKVYDLVSPSLSELKGLLEGSSTLRVRLNTGNGFTKEMIPWNGAFRLGRASSTSENANVAFTFSIKIIALKIAINPKIFAGLSASREEVQLSDMDGDGFPDYVESNRNNSHTLKVKTSTIGRTNMLRRVQCPLGSSFELSYKNLSPTYEMPQAQWVLSEVSLFDGHKGDGVDSTRTQFEYAGGYHDRHERAFFGYKTVKMHQLDEQGNTYRTNVSEYRNDNYYAKGLPVSQMMVDADSKPYTQTVNTFEFKDAKTGAATAPPALSPGEGAAQLSVFPALVETVTSYYEGQNTPQKSLRETYRYGEYGNAVGYTNFGEGNDEISSAITYHHLTDKYIVAVPQSITVSGGSTTFRKRETEVNDKGQVSQIRQHTGDATANYDFEYDQYGNLGKVTRPANYKGERMWFEYSYDQAVHSYPVQVKDAFGYRSSAEYDYKFGGVLRTVDLNNQEMNYRYDAKGRVMSIQSPMEKAAGVPATIEFKYYPEAATPWALTKHYDPQFPGNFMETALFIDGLGRELQTKKDGAIYAGKGQADTEVMIVSGKVIYDAFGRAIASYYPMTEAKGSTGAFNAGKDNVAPTKVTYDVLDRTLVTELPDGAKTAIQYTVTTPQPPKGGAGEPLFTQVITDANGKVTETYTDIRGKQRAVKAPMETWTSFVYNPIGELLQSTDPEGNITTHEYDMLGRRINRNHPDAGLTEWTYDAAGNMLTQVTPNLRLSPATPQPPEGGAGGGGTAIRYQYTYNRLDAIEYPIYTYANVRYAYGAPGAPNNRAGRITLVEDGTGAQEFEYGVLGEVTKTTRTVSVPDRGDFTFVTRSEYDVWNRLTKLMYPDGEEVSYTYNVGGLLNRMSSQFAGNNYKYVTQLGYDKFENRVYLQYGNGTEMTYAYEAERRRLKGLTAVTSANRKIMNNTYSYDAVDNITALTNAAAMANPNQQGGPAAYTYRYDDLYRLISSTGQYTDGTKKGHTYEFAMEYSPSGNILKKDQLHKVSGNTQGKTTYNFTYEYNDAKPHAVSKVGENNYTYDANGNPTVIASEAKQSIRRMAWDEENRLLALADNGNAYHYMYDAGGERVLKGKGDGQFVSVNGFNPSGIGFTGNYSMYVSAYLVVNSSRYTKHFYIEGQRVASKMSERQIEKELAEPKAGTTSPPALPTGEGAPADAGQAPGVDYAKKHKLTKEALYAAYYAAGMNPEIATAGNSGKIPYGQLKKYFEVGNGNNGNNGNGNSGNGNVLVTGKYENLQFFYHPDHLGSSNYITDASGEVYQHNEYFPYGETFVEERNGAEYTNYLFSGKELDTETGLYYFGARYQDPRTSIFLNIDPLAEKYPNISPYAYCNNNPIKFVDPTGMEGIVVSGQHGGSHKGKEHFLQNGLDRAEKALKKRHDKTKEGVTWIIFNDGSKEKGYDSKTLNEYKQKAKKLGINVKEVNSVDKITDYINNKTGGDSRNNDKITSFYYIGHALPSTLNPGYPNASGALDPDKFNASAFASGTWINVVGGCRTDMDDHWLWDDSVTDKFRRKVDKKSTIHGSSTRTYYPGGVASDEQLLEKYGGKIKTYKGKK